MMGIRLAARHDFREFCHHGITSDAVRRKQMGGDRFFSGLEPGMRVSHPTRQDWGEGQVQSVIGHRVTVNFEHAGKVMIDARVIALRTLDA
jgi:FKBP-type peptidyl-prolyl cis-trans isomerase 2